MTSDYLRPSDRLDRLSPDRWQTRLALLLFAIAIILALMCENVNAAPQELTSATGFRTDSMPVVAAPFTLSHPICTTGFLVAQRIDTRDRFGIIVKRQWVPGCAKGKIIYGGKV